MTTASRFFIGSAPLLHFATSCLAVVGAAWSLAANAAADDDVVHRIAILPSGSDAERHGLVRIANNSETSGTVTIEPIDESGRRFDALTLDIAAGSVAEFTSADLEEGNPGIGLTGATGAGEGDWWLEIASELDIEPRVYASRNGFLTAINDTAPRRGEAYRLVTFNPGSNPNQVGMLRLVNPGSESVSVTVRGTDDEGASSEGEVTISLPTGAARTYTAAALESGDGADLAGALGPGFGKWRLDVMSTEPILVMSLLASPTGHLTNLSVVPADKSLGVHGVALFPSASDAYHRQGFVRVVNLSPHAGEVRIDAFDDTEWVYEAPVLALGDGHTAHFNSDDLELGNPDKELTGSTGAGEGDWRLELTSALDLEVLSYIRTRPDGFVTAMHDTAPQQEDGGLTYYVPVFHPAAHAAQESWLYLGNPGDGVVDVSIRAVDDDGEPAPEGEVGLVLAAGETRTLTAGHLERGAAGLGGRLGTGAGRWRLYVAASGTLRVVNLGHSGMGPLANLSRARPPAPGGPDLVLESILTSDARLAAGATLTLSATVRNQGGQSSATTTLRYYLSDDDTITEDDAEAGTDEVAAMASQESSREAIEVSAPNSAGVHYYGACADAVERETNTANNCSAAVGITIPEPPAPDLVVGPVSVSDTGPEAGTSFTLAATVRNRGPGESAATKLRYYRSSNSAISRGDTEVGSDAVQHLAPDGSSQESIGVTAPAESGTYYYGACADAVARESNTGNNCSSAVGVTVQAPRPDLVVSASASEDSVITGTAFELSATVQNRGRGDASATTLRYYRSTDDAISTADTEIGSEAVDGVVAGADSDTSLTVTAPAGAGTYYYGACVDAISRESNTGNNCSRAVRIAVFPPPPDLVVTASAGESVPDPGSVFPLSATVRNQGTGESSETTLRYYRSADATISTSDVLVGSDAVARLAAAGTSTQSETITAPTDPGTYYYGGCVDPVAWESDTTNNCSSAVRIDVLEPPDLVVDHPEASDTRLHPDTEFTFSATVRNQGTGESDGTMLRYYLSTDATITVSDTDLATTGIGGLDPGGTSRESALLTAPATPGTYYYGACVDAVARESDTTNNCSEAVEITVPEPSDLVVSASSSEVSMDAGEAFTLSATVRNIGAGTSDATTLRYYRSTDDAISTADTEIGSEAVDGVVAGADSDTSLTVTAPAGAGTYYYGACVDAISRESNTGNNCSRAVRIAVFPPPPDLVVTASAGESVPDPGSVFPLSATVRNQGTGESSETTLRYYRSADATISTSDVLVGSDAVARLAAAGTSTQSETITAPTDPGTYYYGGCVDPVAWESDTTNNCSSAVRIDVLEPPDLVVDHPEASDTRLHPDTEFTFSATVRNQGTGESDGTMLRYYLSTDATITVSDTDLATTGIGGLDPGGTSRESALLTAPATPGTYYYGACVDAVARESDTTNNCSEAVEITVPEPSDLVVSASSSEVSMDAGEAFTLSATVRNIGAGTSDATTLRYYRSTDATISPTDVELDDRPVEALDPEVGSAHSASLHAPADAGTYYYGACVDPVPRESDTTNNCSMAVEVVVTSTLGHGAAQYRYRFEEDETACRVRDVDAWIAVDQPSPMAARTAAKALCSANAGNAPLCERVCDSPPCPGPIFLRVDFRSCAATVLAFGPDRVRCEVRTYTGYTKDGAESRGLEWCNGKYQGTARCRVVTSACNTMPGG